MYEPESQRLQAGRVLPTALLLLTAAAAGLLSWRLLNPPSPATSATPVALVRATLLPEFRELPPFSLIDDQGKPFDNGRLRGYWTLLSFGYTRCPDICPTNLAMLAEVDRRLRAADAVPAYQIGFVSVDPERDSPQHLKEYVRYFDPDFLGITGSDRELQALSHPLGILYQRVETKDSAMDYVMDHSAQIVLLDPEGRYHAVFSPPHDAAIMARDFLAITQEERHP